MAKKPEEVKEGRLEKQKSMRLSTKEALKRMWAFGKRREKSLPLSEKARIEVYVPALPQQTYKNLLDALEQECTYTLYLIKEHRQISPFDESFKIL